MSIKMDEEIKRWTARRKKPPQVTRVGARKAA